VLRICPVEMNINATKGMMEWIHFLSIRGAPVSKTMFSENDELVEFIEKENICYAIDVSEKAKGILAENLPEDKWNDELYQNIGKAVGKMHALAKEYIPSDYSIKRPNWNMICNNYNPPGKHLDFSQSIIKEKYEKIMNYIYALPKDKDCYGLIHNDLHFANFFVDLDSNTITLFDFDDCSYGWFIIDIATPLFDIVVLYNRCDKEKLASRFLKTFLKGYVTENNMNTFWVNQLPYLLKELEIYYYSLLYEKYDVNDHKSWVGKFMANRKYRIENDIPYISIDFETILEKV
jgi:Ser/Thr protein kinase RdoA (MazF antagonist)